MKTQLFKIGCAFAFTWILGEVCQSTYSQNIVYSTSMALAYAIYLGAHTMAWKQLKIFIR